MTSATPSFGIKVWIDSFRLRTLPLAFACILMGSFLASFWGEFRWDILLLTILTTLFLQILSNLANDFGDSVHGADSEERIGPRRAVQSGRISPGSMRKAILTFAVLSLVTGIVLLLVALGGIELQFLVFFMVGLSAMAAAVYYTMGKRPYGYLGFGDVSVLIFFGIVGVMGTFYLQTKYLNWEYLLPALTIGLFSVAVLNINNIRDIKSDQLAGKMSIPVRLGRSKAVVYHWLILSLGWSCALVFTFLNYKTPFQLIYLILLPAFIRNAIGVLRTKNPDLLDPFLKQMAITTLFFVILYGTGLLLV